MQTFLTFVAVLLLVLLNGFFVAAEFSLVKLRSTRVSAISRQYGWRGRVLLRVHANLEAYLSACQLGITLASLGLGWLGEPAFAHFIALLFSRLHIMPPLADALSLALAFLMISFLHIVAGELAPKSLAIRMPERASLLTAVPLCLFYWIMYPAIALLNDSSNRMLAWFGLLGDGREIEAPYGRDELKLIVRASRCHRQFSSDELSTLSHSLEFSELTASDLMRPLREALSLNVNLSFDENLALVAKSRYGRYPLFDESGDQVLGMVDVKDLLFCRLEGHIANDLRELARPVLEVLPEMPAPELLRRFRSGSPHFAVIGRPGLKPVGFVTLPDLLAALVGQIQDDTRTTDIEWQRQPDGSVIGRGSLSIVSLEHLLSVDFGEQSAESVGGMILDKLGELPQQGQIVDFGPCLITVDERVGPRIVMVKVSPKMPSAEIA
ncbi:hemolysin family protein [Candidatus Vallotia tarda]|uniref:Magnesium and cobalt efflux protein corC n=1 Tax=Candidatus Vallotiella hemipterorum TaxID=1177213 RepID=A0A916NL58_9BURK|nr:hemolysin family protein [Candidatus Vallotia tarda]CAG7600483.1 Magnesium and cobalt efflux protein corC [Candidatus Vallotia tarda]